MIDLLQIEDFLDADALRQLRAELDAVSGAAATVLGDKPGRAVQSLARKSTRLEVSGELSARVKAALEARRAALEAHFDVPLGECEPPQFLKYDVGDYFVAHQDGNTPMVHDQSRFRRVSVVVFLSPHSEEPAPGSYGGGALVFHAHYSRPQEKIALTPAPGTLVAFKAETTHEVMMVTHGERLTIAGFFRGRDTPPLT